LDSLIASGISPDTIAAVSLIPLVAVAWADKKLEAKERDAILNAATEAGISAGANNLTTNCLLRGLTTLVQ